MEPIPARDARPARGSRGRAQEVDLHVAARLRERRLVLGLTQQQVAERVGGSTQQVHKCETGVNRLSAGRLHQFAEALEVGVGDFFAGLEPTAAGVATAPAAVERQRRSSGSGPCWRWRGTSSGCRTGGTGRRCACSPACLLGPSWVSRRAPPLQASTMPRPKPSALTGTAELNAMIGRVAPTILRLLADGVPRIKGMRGRLCSRVR